VRYVNAENIPFTTYDERKVMIKDILPIAARSNAVIKVRTDMSTMLDEIASRSNVYGSNMESSAYRIFDENVVEIFEARFNLGVLKELRVPT
jgi:hypothetical protein